MHIYKTKETALSPVQKKTGLCASNNKKKSDNQSVPWYGLEKRYYNLENNVVQLRDDTLKISAEKCGTDPTRDLATHHLGIGLTAHHIIPASELETFYNICNHITGNKDIMRAFNEWKRSAIGHAEHTAARREKFDRKEVKSACLWMSGNIFIGPKVDYRIDDKGDKFDYGGYRRMDVHEEANSHDSKGIENGNEFMDKLKSIYNLLIYINQTYQPQNVINNSNDRQTICHILEVLREATKSATTLHEGNTRGEKPAYDRKDWISVGQVPIYGMKDLSRTFAGMYRQYNLIKDKDTPSDSEQKYYNLFKERIEISKYQNEGQCKDTCTMTWAVYKELVDAYPK